MARVKYLLISSLVIILSLFLLNHFGLLGSFGGIEEDEPEQDLEELEASAEEEPDPENDNDGPDYITGDTLKPASKPKSDPSFNYQSDVKVNGVVEENLGEEWWVLD